MDTLAGPPRAATSQEFAADLVRYRKLATALAVQRKSGHADGPPRQADVSFLASRGKDARPSLARALLAARTGPAAVVTGAIALALGLFYSPAPGWLWIDGRDVNVPGLSGATDTASSRDAKPELQHVGADPADAGLLLALEAAVVANSMHDTALADLRHRLQQAEAIAGSYAARLVQEQADRRILEEELAARPAQPARPELAMAPSPSEAGSVDKSHTSTTEPPLPAAASLQPTEAIRSPVPSAAILDRLMLRAGQLREQGDIAAVWIILESGKDSGHGPAPVELAETYDPAMLGVWGTFGTNGDMPKAYELYPRAEAAGVAESIERPNSLPRLREGDHEQDNSRGVAIGNDGRGAGPTVDRGFARPVHATDGGLPDPAGED